jgi:hypothetical protein
VLKYVVWNVANAYGKTATFMPKPYAGDNGSGMHVHQSVWKDGKNLFAGDGYAGLSDFALYYIGGIIKHARALNAITNPGTNSYKRLVPGFEAPVKLAYSSRNRSASIRIPFVANPKGRRIEARFPDPLANPYLCFSALMMAGLDGVENKIHPGEAATKDLYHLPPEEDKLVPTVCHSLDQALDYLDKDRGFLTKGGVFTDTMLDAYIELKMGFEVTRFRMATRTRSNTTCTIRCNCGNEYTNNKAQAQARGCKLIEGGNVTVVQGPRSNSATAKAGSGTGTPAASGVRAPSAEQKARDSDARQILQSELKKAQTRQDELQKEYNNGQPDKRGDEVRNYQKYLDRVAELKAALARNESDMAGIRRELDRLPDPVGAAAQR